MKKLFLIAIVLISLIPLARTAFAASATNEVPATTRLAIKGTLQSSEIYSTTFPTLFVSANGSGDATELGQFSASYQMEVNLLDMAVNESISLTGFHGDSIEAKAVGQAIMEQTGTFRVVEIYTVTGGTGRFAGASGTLTLNRSSSFTSGIASSTFEGYILLPPQ